MGKLGESTIFASETVALDVIGASYLRDVEPGEVILVNDGGIRSFSPFDIFVSQVLSETDRRRLQESSALAERRLSGVSEILKMRLGI